MSADDPREDGWQPELDELARRSELARRMGGEERLARHRAAGRLPVRERIDRLLDPGSFHETGLLAGKPRYENGELVDFTPSNFVLGRGRIDGRPVVVGGDDFTVRGGAADGSVGNKAGYGERMAHELRLPIVRLVDGTGGGGSVRTLDEMGRTYVPANPAWDLIVQLLGEVPVVAAALGPVAGLGAARLVASHFSVMVRGSSQVFIAGPPVVERGMGRRVEKEELGGSFIHAHGNGVVDNEVASEEQAFEHVRRFLSYLPGNVWEAPPRVATSDQPGRREEELLRAIPRDRRRPYDVRRILELVLDRGSLFEIGRYQGPSLVTVLARLDGHAVGVLANDPRHHGGGLTAAASDKMTRFVDLCDTFHLPVVHFVDNPGFVIGVESEREGTIRRGVRALYAIQQTSSPWVSVLLRRVFGVAGAGHGKPQGLNLRYAWPSGDWGSLPIEGGVQAAYRREIEAAGDPDRRRAELEAHFEGFRSPFRTAEAFGVEEIIDPRDTRRVLVEWVHLAQRLVPDLLGPIARAMRP
jgi:acetyl-CoA carboxylase carboxyltransferase component